MSGKYQGGQAMWLRGPAPSPLLLHCWFTVPLHWETAGTEQPLCTPPPQFTVGSTLDSKGSNDGHGGARLPQVFCINCSLFIGLNYKLLGRGGHCVMEQRDWWWGLVTAESLEVSSHLHIHETGILGGSDAAGFFCCRTVKATIDLKQQFPNRITLNMTPKYRLGFFFCCCNTKESEQWSKFINCKSLPHFIVTRSNTLDCYFSIPPPRAVLIIGRSDTDLLLLQNSMSFDLSAF